MNKRDKARARIERSWESGEETPHGYILVNGDFEILGWGETPDEAVQDARRWQDDPCCPFCGRHAGEHSWRVYLCDRWVMDVWYGSLDVSLIQDGWIVWAAELEPPRYVTVEDAECVVCRNQDDRRDECEACDTGRIEWEGVEPDAVLPSLEHAAWKGVE